MSHVDFLLHVAVGILERKAFLSRFRGILCGYFLGHVAHCNFLPWPASIRDLVWEVA